MQQISQKYKSATVSQLNYKCHEVISSEHAHTLFRKNRDKIWKFLQKSFSRESPELIPSTAKKKKWDNKKIGKGIQERKQEREREREREREEETNEQKIKKFFNKTKRP